jgi:hypothetical protein
MIVGLVDIQNISHNSNHIQYFVSQILVYIKCMDTSV